MIKFKNSILEQDDAEINLTPLVDVIFLLLIFFMIYAVNTGAKGIELKLPSSESHKTVNFKSWTISIKDNKSLFLNDYEITVNALEKALRKVAHSSERPERIVVRSEGKVPFEFFVSLTDLCRTSGFTNIVIATKKKRDD